MNNVLVIRMSALGDVAMSIPVIYSVARANPQTHFTVLTQPFPANFFINMPENVSVIKADVKNRYGGLRGLLRLGRDMSAMKFDAVADLHDVLRSKVVRAFLRLYGVKSAAIDKGRKEKKNITGADPSKKKQLKTSFERYSDVFRKLGFGFELNFCSIYEQKTPDYPLPFETASGLNLTTGKGDDKWVGVAPFAKHKGKIYPMDKCEALVRKLSDLGYVVFLFGAGPDETTVLEKWSDRYDNVISLAGRMKIAEELAFMARLDVMVSMDSANMHLASLVDVPVVSVWGATHPYAGFLGWNQNPDNAVGLDMECRPCSVFGNKPCKLGDYPCMGGLSEDLIIARINKQTGRSV